MKVKPDPSSPALLPKRPSDCSGWKCSALKVAHSLDERSSFPTDIDPTGFRHQGTHYTPPKPLVLLGETTGFNS